MLVAEFLIWSLAGLGLAWYTGHYVILLLFMVFGVIRGLMLAFDLKKREESDNE
jgi:hypothetical protein